MFSLEKIGYFFSFGISFNNLYEKAIIRKQILKQNTKDVHGMEV